jgi:hypothetical protein
MIEKRAPLPWVEVQDQPRKGAGETEKGAPGAIFSKQLPQKSPDTTTTASRNNTVICPHLGKKYDTLNTPFHTINTTIDAASEKNHKSEVTIESAGLSPSGAGLMQSVRLTLDAARRKGSPHSYRAFGRIQPQNSLRGQRPKAIINNKTPPKQYLATKKIQVTHALLCCACLSTVLKLACTQAPPTEKYPAREFPLPHLAGTTDPHESTKLGKYKVLRREDKADAIQEDPEIKTEKTNIAQHNYKSHTTEGAIDLQETQGQHPAPKCYAKAHNTKRQPQASHTIDTKGKRSEDPAVAPRGGQENSADRTYKTRQTRQKARPTHRLH